MIDLHTHILHDLDDGARSLEAALAMARAAVADGVRVMAATPHGRRVGVPGSRYSAALLHERLAELRAALAEAQIPLELVAGTEIYGEGDLPGRLAAGELLPYAGARAVLVEFAYDCAPEALEQIVFGLQLAGWRVVLAHPERLHYARRDMARLAPLVRRGALLQLTGDALLGRQGPQLQQLAEGLLAARLVQLIASDAHGPHFERMPNLGAARDAAARIVGAAAARRMVEDVPAAVLSGAPVAVPEPDLPRRRGWV